MGELRFVGIGETRGYPYLVCKIEIIYAEAKVLRDDRKYNPIKHGYSSLVQ